MRVSCFLFCSVFVFLQSGGFDRLKNILVGFCCDGDTNGSFQEIQESSSSWLRRSAVVACTPSLLESLDLFPNFADFADGSKHQRERHMFRKEINTLSMDCGRDRE